VGEFFEMAVPPVDKPDSGSGLRWTLAGWAGCQVGGTLWLLIASVVLTFVDPLAAQGPLLAFVMSNMAGIALWNARGRMSALAGILWLLGIVGVLALGAVLWVDSRGHLGVLWQTGNAQTNAALARDSWIVYAVLLTYPALMLSFWIRERVLR